MIHRFRIPSPPSVNSLFANVPGKGRVRSHRYRNWSRVALQEMRYGDGIAHSWETYEGQVAIEIISGAKRQDLDNCSKALLDLIVDAGVIKDDDQVAELHIVRGEKSRETIVTVRSLDEPPAYIPAPCHDLSRLPREEVRDWRGR